MSLKRREFRDLRQGDRSMYEYGDLFNKLARYAPDDVSTDRKRQDEFMRGLNDELSIQLCATRYDNYQELLDMSVIVESMHKSMENRKRKHSHVSSYSGTHQKPHTSYEDNNSYGTSKYESHNHYTHGGNRNNQHA